jgi:5'-3' exoribonuclease 1
MGVPKFFRWLSERYPSISQLIAENRIPEFDCLYLDMNGIIHNCTHKDTGEDVSFRLTEEEMFIRIFNYIEHLFGKIKPKQLFFMAIDGVAPRAKMNQQRARRFRTALDAEKAMDKAIRDGVELPKEPPFDSNCITPGTAFMAKLSLQLRYFVNKKVSEDSDWQRCEVVLSGHEVPGEGEHKIMEYIRNAKAQPTYNANVRHCLYGLDADLIMLGLLSHDPHFCLLREEVTFGRASQAKSKELEHQNFYLLHLCIVREYLELEFQELKQEGAISFPYNLENIIDDFILMAFFVGNDFLPHLPNLHINEGALAKMFRLYKRILPATDGYINENGVINLKRLGLLLDGLSEDEKAEFEDSVANEKWFQSKQMEEQMRSSNDAQAKTSKGKLVITMQQKELWKKKLKPFITQQTQETLDLGHELNAADRKFVADLADAFRLQWSTKADDEGRRNFVIQAPIKGDEDDEDEEGSLAANRLIKKYDGALAVTISTEEAQRNYEKLYDTKKHAWKTKYYLDKFPEWESDKFDSELVKLCENYVQGLQWVLYYYYRGIASWPWFYAYHYSPMTSDVVKGLGADLNFKKGQPFRPYEQLMGVLPDRSKSIVPTVYWELMTDPKSPIIDFYPRDFELDMNGKKMEWEAVVKIPFIQEDRLLQAMAPKNLLLAEDEAARNGFGVAIKFTYSANQVIDYPSSLPGIFPDIKNCRCIENIFDLPSTEGLEYRVGLMNGAKINVEALAGFPTMHTLPYTASLIEGYGINVFQSDSRNPSMVINLSGTAERTKVEANKLKLGKRCFVGYPFLQEARIIKVSDELCDYTLDAHGRVAMKEHSPQEINDFDKETRYIENWHAKRLGITIGTIESLVTVDMLKGLIKTDQGALIKEYGPNPSLRSIYASQTIVDEVVNEDERFIERAAVPIEEEFPVGTQAFFLGDFAYGRPLEVLGYADNKLQIAVAKLNNKEPEFAKNIIFQAKRHNSYKPSFAIAKQLHLHPLLLSKITSSFQIHTIGGLRVNLGLNLKFEGKKLKVLGYSQKTTSGWEFSAKAVLLLASYMGAFPDFFAALSTMAQKSEINDTDIWPDKATAQAKVKEIVSWLKKQETNKFEKVPLDAEQLDSDVVQLLAQEGEKMATIFAAQTVAKLNAVPRSAILKPSDAEVVLSNQTFEVGDRVTYAAGNGKVPIATKGTVVGLTRTATALLLDVVLDIGIMSGNTLGGRVSSFRGQTVASSCVINLTSRQVSSDSEMSWADVV